MIDTSTWARTPRGKIICPDCGATGYDTSRSPGPSWLDKHRHHSSCPDCGETKPTRSMNFHRRYHR